MDFKNMKTNFTFTDISLFNSMEKNQAIKRMEQINATVDWSKIESILMRNYSVGKSFEGNDAYPPLILMKCLLQQWSKIDSDRNWKPESTTESPSKSFRGFLLTIPLPTIPLSPGSEEDSLKKICA